MYKYLLLLCTVLRNTIYTSSILNFVFMNRVTAVNFVHFIVVRRQLELL